MAACARTGPQDVQDGLNYGSQVGFARPPQQGIGGEVDGKCRPLRVAQPRGVGWGGSFHGLSSFCLRHGSSLTFKTPSK